MADGGLGSSASALFGSSLDDATVLLCDAIERFGEPDPDEAHGVVMAPVMSAPRAHSSAAEDTATPRTDDPCELARASGATGVAAASSRRPLSNEPNGPALEPLVGLLRRESQRS
jgi:hypothetical protein